MRSILTLYEVENLLKTMVDEFNKVWESVAKRVVEELEQIKDELEKKLGFRILRIHLVKPVRYRDVEIEVTYCYKGGPGFYQANEKFREILEKDYGVPEHITRKLIVVGSISRKYCPFKDTCDDEICD